MKKVVLPFLLMLLAADLNLATTHTITNSGFTFTPSALTINVGDTVNFVLDSIHQPREVSQATWNANGNTSNGGFNLPLGGGTVVITQPGVHYYVCVPHASGGMKGTITANAVTGIESELSTIPADFNLMQNYPNPFNPGTVIRYSLPGESNVSIKVYDIAGKEVADLLNLKQEAGVHELKFDAAGLSTGIYFYTIKAGNFTRTRKMILMK